MKGFVYTLFSVVLLAYIYSTYVKVSEISRAMEMSKKWYLEKLYYDDKRYELWDGLYLIVKENMNTEDPEQAIDKICTDLNSWARENNFEYFFVSGSERISGSCKDYLKVDLETKTAYFVGIGEVELVLKNGKYMVKVSKI